VLAVMVALAAGCGLSTNDEPERIGSGSAIDEPAPPPAAPTVAGSPSRGAGTGTIRVWFVETVSDSSAQLVAVERQATNPSSAEQRLLALIREGPTEYEHEDLDFVSHVPNDTDLGDVEIRSNGVLSVELSDNFYDRRGQEAIFAFAQVVFTATEMDGVDRVQFRAETRGSLPVDGTGQSQDGPLGRSDYNELEVGS